MDWLAKSNVSVMMVLATVIVIVAAFITVSFITRLMAGSIRGLEQRLSLSEESLLGFTRVMKGIVWLIAALLILSLSRLVGVPEAARNDGRRDDIYLVS